MCKYCENMNSIMSDIETGYGLESATSSSVFAHISKNPNTNKFYFDFDEDYRACFEIEFCPKCGRKFADGGKE